MKGRASTHFRYSEFDCHDGTPCPQWAHHSVSHLARYYLEPLRQRFGPVTVISGFRTAEYNRQVGGAPESFHVYELGRQGVAADVACARGGPQAWAALLERLSVPGLGLYDGHVHADTRRGHARW